MSHRNIHLLHALDLAGLYETAELGDGLPFLLLCQLSISRTLCLQDVLYAYFGLSATAATATSATTSTVTTAVSTRTESAASGGRSVSHDVCWWGIRLLDLRLATVERVRRGGRAYDLEFLGVSACCCRGRTCNFRY